MQSKRSKKYLVYYLLGFVPLFSLAQHDVQTSILTDDGIFTVSQTGDGNDMILFNTALWDDMLKGTKYTSHDLSASIPVKIYIQITNKTQRYCRSGIGFRCSIFDNNNTRGNRPVLVNSINRICSAMIQKQDAATIKMIFLDKVDWNSLQEPANGTTPNDSIPALRDHACCPHG